MWIVIRVTLAVIGFVVRLLTRRRRPRGGGVHEGEPYFLREHRSGSKKPPSAVSIGMPLASPTWIRFHAESRIDRFCKRIGIANELATGDAAFDDHVYVTCDHPAVAAQLAASAELRAAIRAALELGARAVVYDGTAVWIERIPSTLVRELDREVLAALHRASTPLTEVPRKWFADRFLWKALLVEGLVWSVFAYGVGAIAQLVVQQEDVYLRPLGVIGAGLVTAAAAFLTLLVVIALWLRGSSRGHRLIVEGAVVLALGLPVASIQVVGDTNRGLDDAPPTVVYRTATECEVREHRGRRGRKSYSYHLHLAAPPEAAVERGPRPPYHIRITAALCRATYAGASVELAIKPGRWGLPWYQHIVVGTERWTP